MENGNQEREGMPTPFDEHPATAEKLAETAVKLGENIKLTKGNAALSVTAIASLLGAVYHLGGQQAEIKAEIRNANSSIVRLERRVERLEDRDGFPHRNLKPTDPATGNGG